MLPLRLQMLFLYEYSRDAIMLFFRLCHPSLSNTNFLSHLFYDRINQERDRWEQQVAAALPANSLAFSRIHQTLSRWSFLSELWHSQFPAATKTFCLMYLECHFPSTQPHGTAGYCCHSAWATHRVAFSFPLIPYKQVTSSLWNFLAHKSIPTTQAFPVARILR